MSVTTSAVRLAAVTVTAAAGVLAAPGLGNAAATRPTATRPTAAPVAQVRATPQPCASSALTLRLVNPDSGLGHQATVIQFTNASTRTCTLYGYPGVAGLTSSGGVTAPAARATSGYLGGLRSATRPATVTLAPGQTASAMVEAYDGGNTPRCPALIGLQVYVPNTATARRVTQPQAYPFYCTGFAVHPVVPGATGTH